MGSRIAVDIGGTFTDVVAFDERSRRVRVGKALSTPSDLVAGIEHGLVHAGVPLSEASMLVHGSTVVINALIERVGARTALVTTRGFRDIYEIGRINRPDAFNLSFEQHRPLIARSDVYTLHERLRADGGVHTPLDEDEMRALARTLVAGGYEAVAVAFLHSYRNPDHEVRAGRILAEEAPDVFVSLSHELTREYREFERTSTVAANAFVGPVVSAYLKRLDERLRAHGNAAPLGIMQSNGGISDVATVRRQAVQMMESGPAGGVVGTIEACRRIGYRDAIAFDMGGTTAKASVVRDLTFPQAVEYFVGGYVRGLPIRIPCLDIVEVGTGGGSIAAVHGGSLRVGPRSAGAEPGPACYGRGGAAATVTDAAVVLGVLASGARLSNGLPLDGDAAARVVAPLAAELGLSLHEAAGGILAIAASSMANAVRAVTTERGLDPRSFALFAYGGSGPLHISLIARELGITHVVVPPEAAVFSALGMLMADLRRDVVLTDIRRWDEATLAALDDDFAALAEATGAEVAASGIAYERLTFVRGADMRYVGQEHALTIKIPVVVGSVAELKSAFDTAHRERFGHSAAQQPAEIVSLRMSAIGEVGRPGLAEIEGGGTDGSAARAGARPIVFDAALAAVVCPVYSRARLRAGDEVSGPAVIEEPGTSTVLRPGDRLRVDPVGNLLLTIGAIA